MRKREFLALSFDEVDALRQAHENQCRIMSAPVAQLTAIVVNRTRGKNEKPSNVSDFVIPAARLTQEEKIERLVNVIKFSCGAI